jgi:hypothetical protein
MMIKNRISKEYRRSLKDTGRFFRNAGSIFVLIVTAMVASSCAMRDTTKAPDQIYQGSIQNTEEVPKPGDIKMISGVEYIYARNRRYMTASYEPEYLWIKKDQYSPGLFESLAQSNAQSEKEYKDLKKRIERLEGELNKIEKK